MIWRGLLEIDREMIRIKHELTGTPEGQFLPWPGEPAPNRLPPDSERYRELTARLEALGFEQQELTRKADPSRLGQPGLSGRPGASRRDVRSWPDRRRGRGR